MKSKSYYYRHSLKIDMPRFETLWAPFSEGLSLGWATVVTPITPKEITRACKLGNLIAPDHPRTYRGLLDNGTREEHIGRIAWFTADFHINTKIPMTFWRKGRQLMVTCADGRHRLLAAVYLKLPYFVGEVTGKVNDIDPYVFQPVKGVKA